ncbi:unnamed protein product [Arabis nemorensis]|uniref:F-box domain-containing protein n=1 Tax=Arabis nemorensis TaxID=586526 RepID=A0A565B0L8_9BRAS|nr:unnamed protein product [Arabis nemorensis]
MSRVPGKSLARFRLVSKQFRSLFSDPCFLSLHHNHSRDSLFTITALEQKYTTESDFSVDFPDRGGSLHARLYWPSNQNVEFSQPALIFASETGIHLCDPVNKELKRLPDSTLSTWCFDISNYECLVSFGFVDATKQYKVVKWPQDLEENRTRRLLSGLITTWMKVDLKFEVLNIDIVEDGRLKVSRWRRLHRPCPYLLQLSSRVHVNGFIYWTSDFQIVSFSLQDETFSTLNLKPPCFRLDTQGSQKSRLFTLSGSRGNLWMIDYQVPSQIMEIWKMEECAWAKIHKIDLKGNHPYKNDGKVEMLDIWSDQVLFKLSWMPICYEAKTNTL